MGKAFQAGRRGTGVRSDCWVELEPRDTGGIEVVLSSKVEAFYGESIRSQAEEALQALGVGHARLRIEDAGALPFTIAARIECAASRAGIAKQEFLPPFAAFARTETRRDRLHRSRLYLPGNEPKFFINAGLHKPDGVILDLEDAVAPAEKDAARFLVRNALRQVNFYDAERMVRINQGDAGLEDLNYVVPHNVHVILLPKAESAQQVKAVDQRITDILSSLPDGWGKVSHPFIMPIVESALGGIKAYEIAAASPRLIALALGLEDYTADIGVQKTAEGRESFWLKGMVINAARAAGVAPIDSVFSDVEDMDGLLASARDAKALGFEGKGCIHPRQINPIHEAFAPSDTEIQKALRIVQAFNDARSQGLGVVALGSKMIDAPVVKRAQRVVNEARSLGMLPTD